MPVPAPDIKLIMDLTEQLKTCLEAGDPIDPALADDIRREIGKVPLPEAKLCLLGQLAFAEENYQEGVRLYEEAVMYGGSFVWAHYCGTVRMKMGMLAALPIAIRASDAVRGGVKEAIVAGVAAAMVGDYKTAIHYADRADGLMLPGAQDETVLDQIDRIRGYYDFLEKRDKLDHVASLLKMMRNMLSPREELGVSTSIAAFESEDEESFSVEIRLEGKTRDEIRALNRKLAARQAEENLVDDVVSGIFLRRTKEERQDAVYCA